jgi:hypothetical protein
MESREAHIECASVTGGRCTVLRRGGGPGLTECATVATCRCWKMTRSLVTPDAPVQYEYDLDVPEGGQVVDASGGAFAVLEASGEPLALILPLWAKDANGTDVATRYTLDGNTLVQTVDHTQPGLAYPVVADPQVVWHYGLPSLKLNRSETRSATTATGLATVCGLVGRYVGYAAAGLCGLNSVSMIVNAQRIYYQEGRCAQLLFGPGVVGTIGYSGGYCT